MINDRTYKFSAARSWSIARRTKSLEGKRVNSPKKDRPVSEVVALIPNMFYFFGVDGYNMYNCIIKDISMTPLDKY